LFALVVVYAAVGGAGPVSTPGLAGAPVPGATGHRAAPPAAQQALARAVVAPTQAAHPNLPINDRRFLPDPAKLQKGGPQTNVAHGSCYPSNVGTGGGYQGNCVSLGAQQCCFQASGGWVSHFGVDPYNGGGTKRYVYIIDEMEGTRASQWLVWYTNHLNQTWHPQNASGKRPYFVYFTGSYLRSLHPAYASYSGCNGSFDQFMEFCLRYHPQGTSSSAWSTKDVGINGGPGYGKVGTGDAFIGFWNAPVGGPGDPYVEYGVVHEFGHLIGLAHDQDCQSVMTYCGTVGNQYLFWSPSNTNALNAIYDQYPD
jgi:hypothetical protein